MKHLDSKSTYVVSTESLSVICLFICMIRNIRFSTNYDTTFYCVVYSRSLSVLTSYNKVSPTNPSYSVYSGIHSSMDFLHSSFHIVVSSVYLVHFMSHLR